MRFQRRTFVVLACSFVFSVAAPAHGAASPPGSHGTPPPATPQGCHGYQTVFFKQLTGDPAQGPAIVLQTQSVLGRGKTLQQFLATVCGLGSQA
jgi:hypothetical protein